MPKMGTYTQADADRDIAVHAALTTAIHGVGSSHVAGFGVAGQELSKVIWKPTGEVALDDNNRTATLDWTELDLTAYTSERAKFAIVRLYIKPDTVGSGDYSYLRIRENGSITTRTPRVDLDKAGSTEGVIHYETAIIALDNDRKIQYAITPGTGWQLDSNIDVLGYIE